MAEWTAVPSAVWTDLGQGVQVKHNAAFAVDMSVMPGGQVVQRGGLVVPMMQRHTMLPHEPSLPIAPDEVIEARAYDRQQPIFTRSSVEEQKATALARPAPRPDIALSGLAGSGKDTAAQVLVEHYGYTVGKFAKPVYDAVLALDPYVNTQGLRLADKVERQGWEYVKRWVPETRRLLQVMGTEVGRGMFGPDFWVEQAARWRLGVQGPVVWTDTRFPNEVAYVAGDRDMRHVLSQRHGLWVHIDRPGQTLEGVGHASESSLPDTAEADYVITNDGSVAHLHSKVLGIMEGMSR